MKADHPPSLGVERMIDGLLKQGETVLARNMESAVVIEDMLGEGAQAEVYRARIGESWYAVKWYKPEYLGVDKSARFRASDHLGRSWQRPGRIAGRRLRCPSTSKSSVRILAGHVLSSSSRRR